MTRHAYDEEPIACCSHCGAKFTFPLPGGQACLGCGVPEVIYCEACDSEHERASDCPKHPDYEPPDDEHYSGPRGREADDYLAHTMNEARKLK